MPVNVDWSMLGAQIGLGGLFGLAFGFTAKKAFKIALIVLAALVAVDLLLENYGLISIHWSRIQSIYTQGFGQTGGLKGLFGFTGRSLDAMIPLTGSFLTGFFIGLAKG